MNNASRNFTVLDVPAIRRYLAVTEMLECSLKVYTQQPENPEVEKLALLAIEEYQRTEMPSGVNDYLRLRRDCGL